MKRGLAVGARAALIERQAAFVPGWNGLLKQTQLVAELCAAHGVRDGVTLPPPYFEENIMKATAVMAAAATIVALNSAPALAADTDGTIEFSGGTVAAGIGYRWANGTLTYQGHTYPIRLSAISIGDVGGEGFHGTATVHNLDRLEDFEGTFGGAGAGITLGAGGDAQALENENGVTMYILNKSLGLDVNVSLAGIDARVEQ